MRVVQERINRLALPESDCAPLGKQQLDQILSTVKPLMVGEVGGLVCQAYSIADLAPEAAATKLKSLGVDEEIVLICWPPFHEGFRMKWSVFHACFGELWYPSSDDVIVVSPSASWALEITHEETVRFFRLIPRGNRISEW